MKDPSNTIYRSIKICVLLIWVILFAALLQRDVFLKTIDLEEIATIQQVESEEYQSVYFKREKIGYVMQRYSPMEDRSIELTQNGHINLNVAGAVQSVDIDLRAILSENNYLQSFSFSFSSPFYKMEAKGEVREKTVHYTINTGTNTMSSSLTLSKPPLLNTARRSYLLTKTIQPGDKVKIPWFDPVSLTGRESVVEYRGQETIQLGHRIEKLHHFTESFAGARISLWLNDSGKVMKEESPAGFVFIREPKFRAMQLTTPGQDILSAVAVTLTSPLILSTDKMVYHLDFPDDVELDLEGGRQQLDGNTLTISNELKADNTQPCGEVSDYLGSTTYVQTENSEITALSAELTKEHLDPMAKVEAISDWVYNNIDKRPVLGLPDALTTLQERKGDCNEHAALFAALSRAANIPTRIVAGVTSHNNGLYYHAWNEVCIDNRWLSLDTTINQLPADLSHIRLIVGEMQEQVKISSLIGKLTVTQIHEDNK